MIAMNDRRDVDLGPSEIHVYRDPLRKNLVQLLDGTPDLKQRKDVIKMEDFGFLTPEGIFKCRIQILSFLTQFRTTKPPSRLSIQNQEHCVLQTASERCGCMHPP